MKLKRVNVEGFEFLPYLGWFKNRKILAFGWLVWFYNIEFRK
jgi:hypothetical protein